MSRVHHDGIDTGSDQCSHTFFRALAYAHGGCHTQSARLVSSRIGKTGLLGDVLDGDQTLEDEIVADHQQAFELVFVQQRLGLFGGGAFGHGDQAILRRHDVTHRYIVAGFKAQIPAGDDTHHLAAITHRETRHAELLGQGHDLPHRVLRGDDHGVAQHAAFVTFDAGDLSRLLLGCEVFVDDPDATFLGYGDGQPGLGHGVHGGRHERKVQVDATGKTGRERRVLGQDV